MLKWHLRASLGSREVMAEMLISATAKVCSAEAVSMFPERKGGFWSWAFSEENPHLDSWLQVCGVRKTGQLVVVLLGDLVPPRDWPRVAEALSWMCAYQVFEVVSDNLALGLGSWVRDSGKGAARKNLSRFSRYVAADLRGGPSRDFAECFSRWPLPPLSECSLSPEKVETVLKAAPAHVGPEFSLVDALRLNARLAVRHVDVLTSGSARRATREGLVARYESAAAVLERSGAWDLERGVGHATDTILVEPTLAFVASVLGVEYDSRHAASYRSAARAVRLLNDLGTACLELPYRLICEALKQLAGSAETMYAALSGARALPLRAMILPRVQKDVTHGESNVWLDEMGDSLWKEPASALGHCLIVLSRLRGYYHTARGELAEEAPGDKGLLLARRFVGFHRGVYALPATSGLGEYAV